MMVGDPAIVGDDARTERQAYFGRLRALETERTIWLQGWRDLAEQLAPGSVRLFASDQQRAAQEAPEVINSVPKLALRTMAAGLMSGLTPKSRPWFSLTLLDEDLAAAQQIQEWLHAYTKALMQLFQRTQVYNSLHQVYMHLGWGNAAMLVEEHPEKVLCSYVWPLGSYCLATNPLLEVDTAYQRLPMTVSQLVKMMGVDNVSSAARNMFKQRQYDATLEVLRIIEPNDTPDPENYSWKGMPYRSVWMEFGDDRKKGVLRRSGYREFPIMAPRWEPHAHDVYARGPALQCLPDMRELQMVEKRKLQMLDWITRPGMVGTGLKEDASSLMAGDVTYSDQVGAGVGLRPAYEMQAGAIQQAREERNEIAGQIKQMMYYDLWLALSQDGTRGKVMTAREVAERHEEKLLQLGPASERLEHELLNKLIDRAGAILWRRAAREWAMGRPGPFPPPPDELMQQGAPLTVQYISIVAQAQKLVGIASQERLLSVTGNLIATWPEIKDNIDPDVALRDYAETVGTNPKWLRTEEAVAALREQRAQAAKAQQQQAALPDQAKAAELLSRTDLNGDNALNRLLAANGAGGGYGGGPGTRPVV